MEKILGFAILFILASCSTFGASYPSTPLEVATYDVQSQTVTGFRRDLFRQTFQDGSRIKELSVQRQNDGFYLVREGFRAAEPTEPSCRTESIRLSDDGRGRLTLGGSTEVHLCAGVNCSRCGYVTPGCICLGSIDPLATATCNHRSMGIDRAELLVDRAERREE